MELQFRFESHPLHRMSGVYHKFLRNLKFRLAFPVHFRENELTHHYIFIISQLWLTSHRRSTVVLLDTGTPGTSSEIYSEDANGGNRTRNPSVINRVL